MRTCRAAAVQSAVTVGLAIMVALGVATSAFSQTRDDSKIAASTAAIVFGVGSPAISAERSGTSIGILAGGTLYLFDAGAGVERRIMEAAAQLQARHIGRFGPVFISHLHPDHTVGLAALYFYHQLDPTGHLVGGSGSSSFEVYGPKSVKGLPGIGSVMESIQAVFNPPGTQDTVGVGVRANELTALKINLLTSEISPGVIYKDSVVTVTAFEVAHKTPIAFGFRVQTADRVIVISGDTRPSDALVQACNGCDLLFHEVFGETFGPGGPKGDAQGHTSAEELGELARRARPKHLVVYHDVRVSHETGTRIIKKAFPGEVTFARDLDIF